MEHICGTVPGHIEEVHTEDGVIDDEYEPINIRQYFRGQSIFIEQPDKGPKDEPITHLIYISQKQAKQLIEFLIKATT